MDRLNRVQLLGTAGFGLLMLLAVAGPAYSQDQTGTTPGTESTLETVTVTGVRAAIESAISAKRLLDHGYHPPTVYFPLLVEEALMVEPTETETKETLDRFAAILVEILREAREDPDVARTAPHTTPVRRLDEAGAARRPVVRQAL